ncbi:MAG: CbiQ family ECF transporter T component [Thauera sp.]|jgi:energy-coupling factor transporter transmembrane protein EcfT
MHSGLILLLWLAAVAAIQLLPPSALAAALLACLALAAWLAPARSWRLIRRVRVLLIAIALLFAWFTPGEALFYDWPRLGPSREGVLLAAVHAARLVAVVCAVGVLLERLPLVRLVGGLHALARPLRLIGIPPERLALRLLLVLQYVERAPRGRAGHWKQWLVDESGEADAAPVTLQRERLGRSDAAVAVLVFAALIWWSVQ